MPCDKTWVEGFFWGKVNRKSREGSEETAYGDWNQELQKRRERQGGVRYTERQT